MRHQIKTKAKLYINRYGKQGAIEYLRNRIDHLSTTKQGNAFELESLRKIIEALKVNSNFVVLQEAEIAFNLDPFNYFQRKGIA